MLFEIAPHALALYTHTHTHTWILRINFICLETKIFVNSGRYAASEPDCCLLFVKTNAYCHLVASFWKSIITVKIHPSPLRRRYYINAKVHLLCEFHDISAVFFQRGKCWSVISEWLSPHKRGQWDIPQPSTPTCKWAGLLSPPCTPLLLLQSHARTHNTLTSLCLPLSSVSSPTLFNTRGLSSLLDCSAPGCCSDTEAESVFRMANNKDTGSYRRSVSITPKSSTPFNQFLPTKDKSAGYIPAPLRRKRAERNEDSRRSWANPTYAEDEGTLTRYC